MAWTAESVGPELWAYPKSSKSLWMTSLVLKPVTNLGHPHFKKAELIPT